MKSSFRFLTILLCLALALFCFSACGKDEQPEVPVDQSSEEATQAPLTVELGAVAFGKYTIIEIDREAGTCLAVELTDENSYRDNTYSNGVEIDIETEEILRNIEYTRDSENRITKITYTNAENGDILGTEEFSYAEDGSMLGHTVRDAIGMTVSSIVYKYNDDGTYTVSASEKGRIVSITEYGLDDVLIGRDNYEYEDDGAYIIRSYAETRLVKYVKYAADGSEASRAEYTYHEDGSFTVEVYENGVLVNTDNGTADEAETEPAESTTAAKEVLDQDATVVIPSETTTQQQSSTQKPTENNNDNNNNNNDNNNNNNNNNNTGDLLAQSRVFRSGKFYVTGQLGDGSQSGKMTLAVTDKTMYAAAEFDLGKEMGFESTGNAELGFLTAADGKYYLIEASTKTYCPMDESVMSMLGVSDPQELFGELNFDDMMLNIDENAKPDKTTSTTLNGQAVTCYTFKLPGGEYENHYVDNKGNLKRVDDYTASGSLISTIDINSISGDVPANMQNPPADYTQTDLLNFMMTLLGDAGLEM